MKNFFLIIMLFYSFFTYSQNNNGYIVEYNYPISVEYQTYTPPLRINKIEKQDEVDYSQISGLLQSYLSANNIEWAKSEYIDSEEKIVRDEEHFEAVKKSGINDYIQLETVYTFNYQNRKFAYVKYSLIFEKLPFPWTNLMILENKNNHWYISKLINQNQILLLLGNASEEFIIECLNQKTNDLDVKKIVEKSRMNDRISMSKLSLQINSFDDRLKNKFYDRRIINDRIDFRDASLNASLKTYKFDLYHPFLIKLFEIYEYKDSSKIIKEDKNAVAYQNKPEFMLLTNEPISFLNKIFIDFGDKQFYLIKYKRNTKTIVDILENNNGHFKFAENNSLRELSTIFVKYKFSLIRELIKNPKKEYMGSSGGVNIDEMLEYIKKNKKAFVKYLEE